MVAQGAYRWWTLSQSEPLPPEDVAPTMDWLSMLIYSPVPVVLLLIPLVLSAAWLSARRHRTASGRVHSPTAPDLP